MKVVLFDSHSYDRSFFDEANREFSFQISYIECRLTAETAWMAKGAKAVCISVNDCVDEIILEVLKSLNVKTVALRCAGFDNVDITRANELGIKVVRVPNYSPHSIAEHAIVLILNLSRKVHRSYERVRHGNYSLDGLLGFEIRGKTVGIIGTGGIGSAFAQIMSGFGCNLLACDLFPNPILESKFNVRYLKLEDVLKEADILSLHVPLNAETRHILNKTTFDLVKQGCMLINTGRGGLIDANALIDSLKSGKVSYAGLDVYENEKELFFCDRSDAVLQDDVFARLLGFQNVLITPHQAYFTREALREIAQTTLKNIRDSLNQK